MPTGIYERKKVSLWSKVDQSGGPDACWPFLAARTDLGYGRFRDVTRGRTVLAHRVAWELTHGDRLGTADVIRHTCDNPPCCNPAHLQKGTHYDNVLDKLRKGRFSNGRRRGSLTEAQVVEIRQRHAQGERPAALARAFGVTRAAITQIHKGRTWKARTFNPFEFDALNADEEPAVEDRFPLGAAVTDNTGCDV